jgi:hypothetical protein
MVDPSGAYTPAPMQPLQYTPVPGSSQAMGASLSDLDSPRKGGKLGLVFAVIAILGAGGAVAAFLLIDRSGGTPEAGDGDGSQAVAVVTPDARAAAVVTPDARAAAAVKPDAAAVPAVATDAAVAVEIADAGELVTAEPVVVLVNGSAQGADIFEDGKKIGRSPQMVKVVPGETRDLVLKARGYKDTAVAIDGTREEVAVKMERVGGTRPDPVDPRPDPKPDPKPPTAVERLRELCKKNPSDDRCLMLDD